MLNKSLFETARLLICLNNDRVYCIPKNILDNYSHYDGFEIQSFINSTIFYTLKDLLTDELFLFANSQLKLFSVTDKEIGYHFREFHIQGISTPYKAPAFQSIPFEIPLYGNTINPSWAAINLGGACNSRCNFCYTEWLNNVPNLLTNQVKYAIDQLAQIDTIKVLVFSGGEPTIRKDLLSLFEYANQAGFFDIALHTNGRELKNYNLIEKLIKLGLKRVLISLHGHNEEIHDQITDSPGSFLEALEGLRNLKLLSINPTINIVMCQENFKHLTEIVKLLGKNLNGLGGIRFSYPIVEGGAFENIERVLLPFYQLKPVLIEAMQLAEDMGFKVQLANMPLCIPNKLHRKTTYDTQVISEFVEVSPFYKFNVPRGEKSVKLDSCIQCSKVKLCRGIQIEYLRTYPESVHEFQPINNHIPQHPPEQ